MSIQIISLIEIKCEHFPIGVRRYSFSERLIQLNVTRHTRKDTIILSPVYILLLFLYHASKAVTGDNLKAYGERCQEHDATKVCGCSWCIEKLPSYDGIRHKKPISGKSSLGP